MSYDYLPTLIILEYITKLMVYVKCLIKSRSSGILLEIELTDRIL